MKKNKYTFLEWVFDNIGFGKFILFFYLFCLTVLVGVLAVVWWITKNIRSWYI